VLPQPLGVLGDVFEPCMTCMLKMYFLGWKYVFIWFWRVIIFLVKNILSDAARELV